MMHFRPITFAAAAVAVLTVGGCFSLDGQFMDQIKGTGPVTDKKADVAKFDKMSVEGPFQVNFVVGPTKEIKVEAQKEVIEVTNVKVEAGTLRIFLSKAISSDKPIVVTVSSPNLTSLKIGGACSFKANGPINGPLKAEIAGASHFEATANVTDLEASGASTVTVKGAAGKTIKVVGAGASTITLVANVDEATIEASGASTIKPGISAKQAKVSAEGASTVKVAVSTKLDADANGASTILYSGPANQVSSKVTGASSVNHGE